MIDVFQELETELRIIAARADLHYRSLEQLRRQAAEKASAVCGDAAAVVDLACEVTDVEDVDIKDVMERLRYAALESVS